MIGYTYGVFYPKGSLILSKAYLVEMVLSLQLVEVSHSIGTLHSSGFPIPIIRAQVTNFSFLPSHSFDIALGLGSLVPPVHARIIC
jgi:hypothetical protein